MLGCLYTSGLRLYWPWESGMESPSVGLRLLQLLLQFCFAAASLSSRVSVLLLHGGVFSVSCVSVAVPVVCFFRVVSKALLHLLAASFSADTAAAYFHAPTEPPPPAAPAAPAPAAAAAAAAAAANPFQTQEAASLIKEIFAAEVWIRRVAQLPDFYGPTDGQPTPRV